MELISWRELRSNFDAFGFGDNMAHEGSNMCAEYILLIHCRLTENRS